MDAGADAEAFLAQLEHGASASVFGMEDGQGYSESQASAYQQQQQPPPHMSGQAFPTPQNGYSPVYAGHQQQAYDNDVTQGYPGAPFSSQQYPQDSGQPYDSNQAAYTGGLDPNQTAGYTGVPNDPSQAAPYIGVSSDPPSLAVSYTGVSSDPGQGAGYTGVPPDASHAGGFAGLPNNPNQAPGLTPGHPGAGLLPTPATPVTSPTLDVEWTKQRGKKKRSRWGPESGEGDDNTGGKKRKSRWEDNPAPVIPGLPDILKSLVGEDANPEVQALHLHLAEINRRLQTGQVMDDTPPEQRSPSPEPIYDNMGHRVNTREVRAREKLMRKRSEVIGDLITKSPSFKAPADYKPEKKYKKLYIPQKEYPGYNFIGLIIGPRGNTQKRMEKETGAKIAIRGKGSIKEGRTQNRKDLKIDPGENEDLHVLVQADSDEQLARAVDMVEKLLVPVEEGRNEHKRTQLRELAALNGTLRDDEYCRLCGEPGHRQLLCAQRHTSFKAEGITCQICGDGGHPTIDCPMKGTSGTGRRPEMDAEYKSFLAELGTHPEDVGPRGLAPAGPFQALPAPPGGPQPGGGGQSAPWGGGGDGGGSRGGGGDRSVDDANLYVGYLPHSVDDAQLHSLFQQFGVIVESKVIKERGTTTSKGYGFVKFSNAETAARAIQAMNGYRMEGKMLAVRVAGRGTGDSSSNQSASSTPRPSGPPPPSYNAYGPPPSLMSGPPPAPGGPPLPPGAPMPWPPQQRAPMPYPPPQYTPYGPPPPMGMYGAPPPPPPGAYYGPYGPPMPGAPPPGAPRPAPSQPNGPLAASSRPPPGYAPSYGPYYAPGPPGVGAPGVPPASGPPPRGTAPWGQPPAAPPAQPDAKVESEYEKFMSEMGR